MSNRHAKKRKSKLSFLAETKPGLLSPPDFCPKMALQATAYPLHVETQDFVTI